MSVAVVLKNWLHDIIAPYNCEQELLFLTQNYPEPNFCAKIVQLSIVGPTMVHTLCGEGAAVHASIEDFNQTTRAQ
jgi:hypothetical protein